MKSQVYGINDVISTLDLYREKGELNAEELIGKEVFGGVCVSELIKHANLGKRCKRLTVIDLDFFQLDNDYLCDYIIIKK